MDWETSLLNLVGNTGRGETGSDSFDLLLAVKVSASIPVGSCVLNRKQISASSLSHGCKEATQG